MPRVLMKFQHRKTWSVHFIEEDCRTSLRPGGFYRYTSIDQVRQILIRAEASPQTFAEFENCVLQWSRGSIFLDLTDQQHERLKKG
jgi:hypothetical protein